MPPPILRLSTGFYEAARRLAAKFTEGARTVHTNIADIADDLHAYGREMKGLDKDASRSLKAMLDREPDTPVFVYSRNGGRSIGLFTGDIIHSIPILGPGRKPMGVSFPSHPRDPFGVLEWSRAGLGRVAGNYGFEVGGPTVHGNFERRFGRGPRLQALWSDKAKSEAMLFSLAYAGPDGYSISVDTGRTMKRLPVDGYNFGRILAANDHFREALRAEPKSLLIQISSSPAAGSAARESARALHEAGIQLDVYASRESVAITGTPGSVTTYDNLSVHPPADRSESAGVQHWEVYKAPRGPASPTRD
ncbi:hypothetical protein AB0B25_10010 [Nocardia sp. NPDC049190]|uniref:hypothetical protein n=1 Tax=Nocardia sp. NPDC049190 TaxID=3155650 RepID=UPI0033D5A805